MGSLRHWDPSFSPLAAAWRFLPQGKGSILPTTVCSRGYCRCLSSQTTIFNPRCRDALNSFECFGYCRFLIALARPLKGGVPCSTNYSHPPPCVRKKRTALLRLSGFHTILLYITIYYYILLYITIYCYILLYITI